MVERRDLGCLLRVLREGGHTVIGPTVRDGAIALDEICEETDLPIGWTDEQEGGRCRLRRREDEAVFGHSVGADSWKRFLHPPRTRLWRAERSNGGIRILRDDDPPPRFAFVGVRACDLSAIRIQDRALLGGEFADPIYRARREGAFIVAVHCTCAGGTCFCASVDAGPRARVGFDLAMTELIDSQQHAFIVEVGTDRGAEVIAGVPHRPATRDEILQAEALVDRATEQMGRTLDTSDLPALLRRNHDSPHWDDVARRCLACGNCTMVCPTCLCTAVEDGADLSGNAAERRRRWDSCHTLGFSHIHGGPVRESVQSRYRHWINHKLSTWHDQFGTPGCVGCGRCITWCPVGIDITEEAAAIRATDCAAPQKHSPEEHSR